MLNLGRRYAISQWRCCSWFCMCGPGVMRSSFSQTAHNQIPKRSISLLTHPVPADDTKPHKLEKKTQGNGDREDLKFVVHHIHHAEMPLAARETLQKPPTTTGPFLQTEPPPSSLIYALTSPVLVQTKQAAALVLLPAATCSWSTQDVVCSWLLNL